MILNLWSDCEQILQSHFKYDKIFDLFQYCKSFDKLREELSLLVKDSYESNYRFIFLHYDTEFYLYPDTPGIFLTNLQIILAELKIPNYFCLIITNHINLTDELEKIRLQYTSDTHPISNIICQLQQCHVAPSVPAIELNTDNITLWYSCLNHSRRAHRHALVKLLAHDNILERGLISYVA